jgi:hypothetical protein
MRLDMGATAPTEPAAVEQVLTDDTTFVQENPGAAVMPGIIPPETAQITPPLQVEPTAPNISAEQIRTAQSLAVGNADDKDHIVACSIIYQRVSDMYRDRGEREKADSFVRTAYAYSQTADILYTADIGPEGAYDTITQRMTLISDSLNRESEAMPNGDLGVVENWLGWCDERGEFVQNTIDAFQSATGATE